MDIKKLNEFISLAKESGVSELQYENGKEKYHVKIGGTTVIAPATQVREVTTTNEIKNSSGSSSKNDGLVEVTSPFVGTFPLETLSPSCA